MSCCYSFGWLLLYVHIFAFGPCPFMNDLLCSDWLHLPQPLHEYLGVFARRRWFCFFMFCPLFFFVLSFFVLCWEPCNISVPLVTFACFFSSLLVRSQRECVCFPVLFMIVYMLVDFSAM